MKRSEMVKIIVEEMDFFLEGIPEDVQTEFKFKIAGRALDACQLNGMLPPCSGYPGDGIKYCKDQHSHIEMCDFNWSPEESEEP